MSLSSVLQTALTGISAAEMTLSVTANNLANANTNGFKQGEAVFGTQTPGTLSLGSAPGSGTAGTNPAQVGAGVQTAGIVTDFSQGSLSITSDSSDLAIQGNGFFMAQGPSGERLYSRNGEFHVNANREHVTATGDRVLGYAADENFQLDTTQLVTLTIPMGRTTTGVDGMVATMTGYAVGEDGTIRGKFDDGVARDLGQIQLARFANRTGLEQRGRNHFGQGANSGLPITSSPGASGTGRIVSGAVELSNTDIGRNLIDMILAESQLRTSVQVLSVADEMLTRLMSLRRPAD